MTIHRMPQDHRPRSAAPFTPAQLKTVGQAIAHASLKCSEKLYAELSQDLEQMRAQIMQEIEERLEVLQQRLNK